MNYVSTGDMARTFQMRRHNVELQRHLTRLSGELTTGVKSDLAGAVSGDFRALSAIDHSLKTLKAHRTAAAEAELFAGTLQTALGTAEELAEGLAPGLLIAATSASPALVDTAALDARQKFEAAISALNTRIADRYLLSGDATDRKPISDARVILGSLSAAVAGQTTAAGLASAVSAWFDAVPGGGGYLDTAYGGSPTPLAPFDLAPGESVTLGATAADPALRRLLEGFALGALVSEGALSGDPSGRAALVKTSAETLLASASQIADLRAAVGSAEARISSAATRNSAESAALEIARGGIVAADPYETASALETIRTQIETLYTLTARLSRLSLADHLG
ncbi:MAG: flagellin [Paracoccaceae bacterium]